MESESMQGFISILTCKYLVEQINLNCVLSLLSILTNFECKFKIYALKNSTDYILLVDDDEATRFYHSVMAEEAKITEQIIIARNGMEGIDILKKLSENSPEIRGIIFLDINMPAVDGWDVLTEFEKLNPDFVKNQTIVMVSATEHPKDFERIEAHPLVRSYMPKPLVAEKIRFLAESL